MSRYLNSLQGDSVVAAIRNLKAAIIEAEGQISECSARRLSEEEMLESALAKLKLDPNADYLKLTVRACRLGIKAWNLSIAEYETAITKYQREINEIQQQTPEARTDH